MYFLYALCHTMPAVIPWSKWGYGFCCGIGNIAVAGDDNFDIAVSGGVCEVFAAGASTVAVQLYTVGGALAASVSSDGDTAQLSTDGLAKGVYVLRASADGSRTATRKIVL